MLGGGTGENGILNQFLTINTWASLIGVISSKRVYRTGRLYNTFQTLLAF